MKDGVKPIGDVLLLPFNVKKKQYYFEEKKNRNQNPFFIIVHLKFN